jgi:hypothetical protein
MLFDGSDYPAYRDALRAEFQMAGPEAYWLYWQKKSLADARAILSHRGRRHVKARHQKLDRDELDRRIREAIRKEIEYCLRNCRLESDDLAYARRLLETVAS